MADLPESAVEAGAQALWADAPVERTFADQARHVLAAATTEIPCMCAWFSFDPDPNHDLCGGSGILWVLRARDTKEH